MHIFIYFACLLKIPFSHYRTSLDKKVSLLKFYRPLTSLTRNDLHLYNECVLVFALKQKQTDGRNKYYNRTGMAKEIIYLVLRIDILFYKNFLDSNQ